MITSPSNKRNEGVTYSENNDIEVRVGVQSRKAFSQYTGYGEFVGKVRYYKD
jgi:hypothetical protein